MATNVKVLGIGTLGINQTIPLYSPTGTKSAVITSVAILNKGPANRAVILYVVPASPAGNDSRIFSNAALAADAGATVNDVITLSGADSITGTASTGGDVHYAVYGIERD